MYNNNYSKSYELISEKKIVRPKRNNSNAAKKRLAPRIKHGITVRENSAYNMINKNHITIPRPG